MKSQTFFFYDLETSGRLPREDRIMQFAGQRTDMDLNPIGEPVNILVKTTNDTLPSPIAISITGITPQSTQADGLTEAEFCRYVSEEIFTPNTIALGFNSVRFDDEFMRYIFWRNFYDPYEWSWRDGRSRWDMLDVVRITRALRGEGINWPVRDDGKPTNRLELLTKENGISHEHAHDALSDVYALMAVTKLIKTRQPKLFDFLFALRDKKMVKKYVNLDSPAPFVYTSGHYSSEWNHTTVAYPVAPSRNGNILVYDLRFNLDAIINGPEKISPWTGKPTDRFYPVFKELCYNHCPIVAPLGVLNESVDGKDGWQKIGLSKEIIEKNLESLKSHPEIIEARYNKIKDAPEYPPALDPESSLYDSFVKDTDRVRINAVRNADANSLADFHPNFDDPRLPELLLHYKAKNFPTSLAQDEAEKWEKYRLNRLQRQEPTFVKELEELEKSGNHADLVEDLKLWYQSLAPDF